MKSYTDIEQSKKLAEILPLESADAIYYYHSKLECNGGWYEFSYGTNKINHPYDILCWSLTALVGVLPDDCGIDKEDGNYVASYITILNECGAYTKDNPIDAVFEMIMYFHKINLL